MSLKGVDVFLITVPALCERVKRKKVVSGLVNCSISKVFNFSIHLLVVWIPKNIRIFITWSLLSFVLLLALNFLFHSFSRLFNSCNSFNCKILFICFLFFNAFPFFSCLEKEFFSSFRFLFFKFFKFVQLVFKRFFDSYIEFLFPLSSRLFHQKVKSH